MKEIEKSRKQIDEIDAQILSLLNQRMFVSAEIGIYKEKNHLSFNDSDREKEILQTLTTGTKSPVLKEHIEKIYSTIFEASKQWQKLHEMKEFPFKKIGILGMGLIGGSLAKALKSKNPSVFVCSVRREDLDHENQVLDKQFNTLEEMVLEVDAIIIASPLSTIIPYAKELARSAAARDKKLFVIDVASVKEPMAHIFLELTNEKVEFLATHPMAGSEKNGFANSKMTLFVGRPWIITPHKNNSDSFLSQAKQMISFFGAHPLILDPNTHDQYAALISHVPYILSLGYLQFIEQNHPDSQMMTGPGFISFTRLAKDNPVLQKEIQSMNPVWIKKALEEWLSYFTKI